MKTQINKILQCGFIYIRQIKSIKDLLSLESLKTLASALVLSQLDYGNVIYVKLPEYHKNRLQSLINTTVRLFTGTRKYDHISPVLRDLHWLKIDDKVDSGSAADVQVFV